MRKNIFYKTVFLIFILFSTLLFLNLQNVSAQSCPPGDANTDCKVDGADYVIWFNNYSQSKTGKSYGDFNNSGSVEGADYVIWLNNYGKNGTSETPTPTDGQISPPSSTSGILISQSELLELPTSGNAWNNMKSVAYGSWGTPDLKNQDNKYGISVVAGALVYTRTGDTSLRAKTRDGILAAKRTLDETNEYTAGFTALSITRQIGTYPIAADLIDLKNFDAAADNEFRSWLMNIRTQNVGNHGKWKNLSQICENSANNWGTFACPSRIAASIYLGDTTDIQRAANVFRAFLGERQYYPADHKYSRTTYFERVANYTSWSCNEATWTAINPNCAKNGVNLDGVLVEDISRGGDCCTPVGYGIMYSWEALQGIYVSAELLYRRGFDTYNWSNRALKRSLDFMQRSGSWGAISNVASYVPWMANKRYGTSYPTTPTGSGRIMSWGDWVYQ